MESYMEAKRYRDNTCVHLDDLSKWHQTNSYMNHLKLRDSSCKDCAGTIKIILHTLHDCKAAK